MRERIRKLVNKLYSWFIHQEVPMPGDPEWDAKHPFFEPIVTLVSSIIGVWLAFELFF